MPKFDIEPIFVSVCSTVVVEEEEEIPRLLQEIAEIGSDCLFSNRRIEIHKEDIKESVIAFSTDQLEEPTHHEWNYVVVDFYEGLDSDQIHIHAYFNIDIIETIDRFYRQISPEVEEIGIGSVEADVLIDADVSELGFIYQGSSELLLEGVRFSYDSSEYSVYSTESGTIVRGGQLRDVGALNDAGYKTFVEKKLDELQATVAQIAP
jgi:hypothetical protein